MSPSFSCSVFVLITQVWFEKLLVFWYLSFGLKFNLGSAKSSPELQEVEEKHLEFSISVTTNVCLKVANYDSDLSL